MRVLDKKTLGLADFSGNRQHITVDNLDDNPKALLFLMDFANCRRIKIWGMAEVADPDSDLRERLHDPKYGSEPVRLFLFRVEAWGANCPKLITPRFTEAETRGSVSALKDRIAKLEPNFRDCAPESD